MTKKNIILLWILLLVLIPLISSHVCNDVVSGEGAKCMLGCPDSINRTYLGYELTDNGIKIITKISANNYKWKDSVTPECNCSDLSDPYCYDPLDYPSPKYCCETFFCLKTGFYVDSLRYAIVSGNPRDIEYFTDPKPPFFIEPKNSKIVYYYLNISKNASSQYFEIVLSLTPRIMSEKDPTKAILTNTPRPIYKINFYWESDNQSFENKGNIYFNNSSITKKNKLYFYNRELSLRYLFLFGTILGILFIILIYFYKYRKNH
jgi:hypothetical protein